MEQLVAKLMVVAAAPANPTFNHYLFETISAVVREAQDAESGLLSRLFPPPLSLSGPKIV